ncbi:hypothetical protein LF1_10870 [Rubripirellula obstinata]|uniref:Uncharacterized protein n=1 Tax=Rubripirellula obstinata TaxID=406547 RepID=A0A5B1CBS7_9BACT|nr:hypothetical protein [Rubripirellula obstinata]KAA1258567.1 hypothetical protein LF1_10870 [Rubripirellula obstinata]
MARQRLGLQLPQNQFLVSRILGLGLLAIILVGSTGCLRHNTRGGDCGSCQTGTCNTGSCGMGDCGMGDCGMGDCGSGDCGGCETCGGTSSGILTKMANRRPCGCSTCGSGILGRIGGIAGFKCKNANCNGGYGSCQGGNCGGCGGPGCIAGPFGWQQGGLGYSQHLNPGPLGHNAGAQLNNRAFTPGPPTGQTAYPYYTTRGPRDFLMANPPSIGR